MRLLRTSNRLLLAFEQDVALVRNHLLEVKLQAGQVLTEPGDRIRSVYFLEEGVVSKMALFEDGSEIECALVGREGAVGALSAMGARTAVTRDVCHMPVRALMLDAGYLCDAARRSDLIHSAVDRFCTWKMTCAIRNGACNARHPVEARLCRWLLTCSDLLEQREIRLSQDVFGKMLGAQRSSINPILQRLRANGLVALGRSRLMIVDRPGLLGRACECYASMRETEAELWPATAPARAGSSLDSAA